MTTYWLNSTLRFAKMSVYWEIYKRWGVKPLLSHQITSIWLISAQKYYNWWLLCTQPGCLYLYQHGICTDAKNQINMIITSHARIQMVGISISFYTVYSELSRRIRILMKFSDVINISVSILATENQFFL